MNWTGRKHVHYIYAQGTIGWTMTYWLFVVHGLSGSCRADEHHCLWNNARAAIKRSGFTMALLAGQLCFNVSSGPFRGQSHMTQNSGAAHEYFASCDHTVQLFQ
eukprot:3705754-Amphidinium_carterae.1